MGASMVAVLLEHVGAVMSVFCVVIVETVFLLIFFLVGLLLDLLVVGDMFKNNK